MVQIRVRPRAGRCRVASRKGDRLLVEVKSPPEGGRATKQALSTLARAVGLKAGDATLLIGAKDRKKTVLLRGLSKEECEARLEIG